MPVVLGLLMAVALATLAAAGVLSAIRASQVGNLRTWASSDIVRAVLIIVAFIADPLAGLSVLGFFVYERHSSAVKPTFPGAPDNANLAFAEWEAKRREEIDRMKQDLANARTEFEDHLRERRSEEDRSTFEAFRKARKPRSVPLHPGEG